MWVRFAFFALRQIDHDDASWRTVRRPFARSRSSALYCNKIAITELFNGTPSCNT